MSLVPILRTPDAAAAAPDPLAWWKTAFAAGRATIVGVGNSVTEGRGSTARANRWANVLTASLRTAAGVTNGQYYQPGWYDSNNAWAATYHTYGATSFDNWAGNLGYKLASLYTVGNTLTMTVTGSTMDIYYAATPGAFTYKIDAGSAVSVDTTAGTSNNKIAAVSLGSSGTHTVLFTCTTGYVSIGGVTLFVGDTSTGIHYYDCGHSGYMASDFLVDLPLFKTTVDTLAPDLVTVELGLNEVLNSVSAATYQASLDTLVVSLQSLAKQPSVLVIAAYCPSSVTAPTWATYVAAMQAVATKYSTGFLDLSAVMPKATTSGTGFYTTDGTHPNDSGHAEYASRVAAAITPTPSGTVDNETPADTAGGSDTATVSWARASSPADAASGSDTATTVWARAANPADNAPGTDAAQEGQDYTRAAADAADGADAVTPASNAVRVADDTAAGADLAQAVWQRVSSSDDSAGGADEATGTAARAASSDDTATASDAALSAFTRSEVPSDAAGAADSAVSTSDRTRTVSDAAPGSDQVTAARGLSSADSAAGSDNSVSQADRNRPVADPAAGSDEVTVTVGKSAADDAVASDSVTVVRTFDVQINDQAAGADQAAAAVSGAGLITVNDQAGGSDQVTVTSASLVTATDAAVAVDAAQDVRSRVAGHIDTADGSDAVQALSARQGVVPDTAAAGDAAGAAADRPRDAADLGAADDQVTVSRDAIRVTADTADITDQVEAVWVRWVEVADAITANDQINVESLPVGPEIGDTADAADAVTAVWARVVDVDDLLGIVDLASFLTGTPTPVEPEVPSGPTRVALGEPGTLRLPGDPDYRPGPRFVIREDLSYSAPTVLLLEDDPLTVEGPVGNTDQLLIEFTIRARARDGFDDDGNPRFTWSDLLTQVALKWEQRTETNKDTGETYVAGTLLIANPDNVDIAESAVAVDQTSGESWRVTAVTDLPDSTRLQMEQITNG